MEKRFPRISPLPSRLRLDPEDVDSDVDVVEVDQAELCVFVATVAAAAVAAVAAAAGGYEVEFLVAQFNRVGKFWHVTLLCTLLGADGAVLTATTYPLVGIRQSGCSVA
jgi:hypothetical protein